MWVHAHVGFPVAVAKVGGRRYGGDGARRGPCICTGRVGPSSLSAHVYRRWFGRGCGCVAMLPRSSLSTSHRTYHTKTTNPMPHHRQRQGGHPSSHCSSRARRARPVLSSQGFCFDRRQSTPYSASLRTNGTEWLLCTSYVHTYGHVLVRLWGTGIPQQKGGYWGCDRSDIDPPGTGWATCVPLCPPSRPHGRSRPS